MHLLSRAHVSSVWVLFTSALLVAGPVRAQTDVTGTQTGADGIASGGNTPDMNGNSGGNDGGNAFTAQGDSSTPVFTVHDANFTGGMGGAVDGTQGASAYTGGTGGAGLSVLFDSTVTVSSGTFQGGVGGTTTSTTETPQSLQGGNGGNGLGVLFNNGTTVNGGTFIGGTGGLATGTANNFVAGGYGGDGLNVNSSIVTVNAGTFQGGDSGPANGTAPNVNSGFAGSGLNANYNGTVFVNGGTFLGGNGAQIAGGGNGSPGDGIIGLGGNVFVHGGTFLGGTGSNSGTGNLGYGIDVFIGNVSLYGDFALTTDGTTIDDFKGEIPVGEGSLTGYFDGSTTEETFTYRLLNFGGTLAVVPEPASWLGGAILLGVAGLGFRRRLQSVQR